MRPLFLLLFPLFAAGCTSTKTCTLVGCEDAITVTYAAPITGAYTLSVTTPGFASGDVACPSDHALVPDGGFDVVGCTASGFTLQWSGGTPLGSNAAGAPSLGLSVTITPAVTGPTPPRTASVSAARTGQSQPNGAGCDPICSSYAGTM